RPPRAPATCRLTVPGGLVRAPAYDLSMPMRERSAELLAGDPVVLGRRRCARLAQLGEAEPEAIWQSALPWSGSPTASSCCRAVSIGSDASVLRLLKPAPARGRRAGGLLALFVGVGPLVA